jgi:RHS repeat-associated protein
VTARYLYDGSRLLRETKGNDTVWYLYDDFGAAGLELNGTSYYYVRNLQGDVTKIVTSSGATVTEYVYDSWGKVISTSGSMASTVGAKNAIRYRGYYFDTETGLYYLNARYYDPETGRFISPDDANIAIATGEYSLYAYCMNDPVNLSDSTGYASIFDNIKKFFGELGNGISSLATKAWNATIDFLSNTAVQEGLMILGSAATMGFGLYSILTGSAKLGMWSFGVGASSLIGGLVNKNEGGSFLAGWAGGAVSASLVSVVPYGAAIGAFLGSALTDGIDKGWNNIDMRKAGLSALGAGVLDFIPMEITNQMGEKAFYASKPLVFLFLYRGAIGSIITSILGKVL